MFRTHTKRESAQIMRKVILLIVLFISYLNLFSQNKKSSDSVKTTFKYGGYVKMDVINTWYQNGDVSENEAIRDFIFPAQIPVGETDVNQNLDLHVKESRFNFDVNTKINDQEIHGFLELDFLLSSSGNEVVSNSFNPRLRHFYFEWKRLLIGQTWSTFMVVVIPDDLDFAGALEGLVFVRQPQIRYKTGSWMFSIENPETVLIPYQGSEQFSTEKEILPDLVVRKNFDGNWGQWSIAGLYRTLSAKDSLEVKRRSPSYGITTGGKLYVGKKDDDIRMTATYGSGLGRYLAGNFIADGVFDERNSISSISSFNGYVAYNHFWVKKKLSSSFNVGFFNAFYETDLVAPAVNYRTYSLSANLKYDPLPQMRFGIEGTYAYRELLDATQGSLFRLQVSAKYTFGYNNSVTDEKK